MGILPPTNEQIDNYFKGGTTGLELRSAEREQCQGEHTTIGRESEWWIVGSLLTELSTICVSLLCSNVLTATYCRAATVSASPFVRTKKRRTTFVARLRADKGTRTPTPLGIRS